MIADHWNDPLVLLLLGAILLVVSRVLAQVVRRRGKRGTNVRKR
jgi:hypothetical protein